MTMADTETKPRYKDALMERAYRGCLTAAAESKNAVLYTPDGGQRRGSSQACAFWDGFNGNQPV